jgi:hypothetical protein
MSAVKEVDVEQQLRLAAATAAWPATPDLRAGVLARIVGGDASRAGAVVARPVPTARPPRLRPVAAVALALLALLAIAGVAAGLGFRLPGLDIVVVERLPSAVVVPRTTVPATGSSPAGGSPAAGAALNLGSPIPLTDALGLDRPRVLVPASMPAPDTAYVIGAGDRRIVTLAWRAEPGQARLASSDLALTVMAVPGTVDDALITKVVTPGTSIAPVSVGGDRGWWISGAPHELLVERPDGQVGSVPSAIAGDTLVFARDGTLYRLESSLGRDATVAIAESLR